MEWELRIVSEDGDQENIKVPGDRTKYELDFAELDLDSDWVWTCDNGSSVPHYNVTIRAIITKQGETLTGPWSSVFSLQPLCNPGDSSQVDYSNGCFLITSVWIKSTIIQDLSTHSTLSIDSLHKSNID